METKKILKKQKKAEDKLKERQARAKKEIAERKESEMSIGEKVRERRSSNVSATSDKSPGKEEPISKEPAKSTLTKDQEEEKKDD
jgi:hypothetical protein